MQLPALLGNYGRPTDRPMDRQVHREDPENLNYDMRVHTIKTKIARQLIIKETKK